MKKYFLYTDGSCNNASINGEGGYAYVIVDERNNVILQYSEGALGVTNNIMELKAVIEGCKNIPDDCQHLTIYSDSQYAINVLSGRYKAHVNKELIDEFHSMRFNFKVEFKWIKGHNGNSFNELADQLASEAKSEICGDIPEYSMSINVKRHEDGFLIAYAIGLTTFGIYDIVDKNIIYSKDIKTEPRAMAQAILNGIKEIPEGSKVILYSDYSYSNYIFSKFSWGAKANEDIINKIHNYTSRMHSIQCIRYKINILDTAINDMIDNYIPKARMCKRLIPKKQMTV